MRLTSLVIGSFLLISYQSYAITIDRSYGFRFSGEVLSESTATFVPHAVPKININGPLSLRFTIRASGNSTSTAKKNDTSWNSTISANSGDGSYGTGQLFYESESVDSGSAGQTINLSGSGSGAYSATVSPDGFGGANYIGVGRASVGTNVSFVQGFGGNFDEDADVSGAAIFSGSGQIRYTFDTSYVVGPTLRVDATPAAPDNLEDIISFRPASDVEELKKTLGAMKSDFGATSDKLAGYEESLKSVLLSEPESEAIVNAAANRSSSIKDKLKSAFDSKLPGPLQFLEYLTAGVKTVLKGGSSIMKELYLDPPDANYSELVEPDYSVFSPAFATHYGSQYQQLDDAFANFSNGLEAYEGFLTSLERVQGAALDSDFSALERQKAVSNVFLMEVESFFDLSNDNIAELIRMNPSLDSNSLELLSLLDAAAHDLKFSSLLSRQSANDGDVSIPGSAWLFVVGILSLITRLKRQSSCRR